MKTQIVGYIVTTEYFHGEPLQLCSYEPYPWPVLLRGDSVTIFKTKKAAKVAIDKTIQWAQMRENEDENLRPLEWADKDKYKIWRAEGEAAGPHTPPGIGLPSTSSGHGSGPLRPKRH